VYCGVITEMAAEDVSPPVIEMEREEDPTDYTKLGNNDRSL
jgi:hypothetical protein